MFQTHCLLGLLDLDVVDVVGDYGVFFEGVAFVDGFVIGQVSFLG